MQATLGHRIAIGGSRFAGIVATVALIALLTALAVGAFGTVTRPTPAATPKALVEQALIDHRAGERNSLAGMESDALVDQALIDHRAGERAGTESDALVDQALIDHRAGERAEPFAPAATPVPWDFNHGR